MLVKLAVAILFFAAAEAQYGPIKSGSRIRTTTPFPAQEPDYSPDINAVAPYDENSAALSGSYGRPQSPAGAVSSPDNPWLSGVISQNPVPAAPARPAAPSYNYGGAPAPAATQPCNAPGYVCTPRAQCQRGSTTLPGSGSTQCSASEVCCRYQPQKPAYPQPTPQPAPQPAYQPQPAPQPAYQPQPAPQPAYRPQPQPQPAPQPAYRPQPQPQPAYRPPPAPAPVPAYQPQPAYQPTSQSRPTPYQPATPIGGSIYDSQAPPSPPRSVPNYSNNYVTEAPIQRYTGPLNTTPHPGCAAALKCVEETYCTWDGVMADTPQFLTREQVENKVPLSDCQNIETGIIGKCCRDPNYKDPWPAGMMMNSGAFDDGLYHPGVLHAGAGPAPQQPAYQPQPQPQYTAQPLPQYVPQPQPQPQPQYTPNVPAYAPQPSFNNARPQGTRASCGPSANCTPSNLCPGHRVTQPGKACRVPNDDSTGVCCAKLQFPSATNNQQYAPPSDKPYEAPYNPIVPKSDPIPYNRPVQPPKPQANPYNSIQTKPNPVQPTQASYNPPKQQPSPYNRPQPQPNPYNQPQPQPNPTQPTSAPYSTPQPTPAPYIPPKPQPNPYSRPQPQPLPVQSTQTPYSPPQTTPVPKVTEESTQLPAQQPAANPYNAPKPLPLPAYPEPTPEKPESSNDIAPEPETPEATPSTTEAPDIAQDRIATPEPGKDCGVRRQVPRPNGPAGLETGFGEFPWQAQVIRSSDQKPICSGAILAENIVVTAAHCVNELNAPSILVKAGDWKLATENPAEEPKPAQIRGVAAVAVHPQFEAISQVNDMAVLVLDTPLAFDQHVDKLCLGKDSAPGQPPSGTNCVVTGWGKSATKGNVAGSTLHSIPVKFQPNQQCQDAFRNSPILGKYFQLHQSFTCALPSSPNHDLCQVDEGSPIACQKPDGNYELSGIYSWDVGCHPNTNVPAAMSKVDNQWVQSVMDKPVEEINKETEEEKERQGILGQSNEQAQATKPGFSQGYGK